MSFNSTDHDKAYIHKFMNFKMLTKDEEEHLAKEWRDYRSEEALHTLINAYTRLVISMAFKLKMYGIPIDDLIQEGSIGLIIAAEKFNPTEHNARFSTYAKWWIKASQQRYILKNWSIVRMGITTTNKQLFFNLERLKAQLFNITTESLTTKQTEHIANSLHISINNINEMEKRLNLSDLSLNMPVKNQNNTSTETLETFIPDRNNTPEEEFSTNETTDVITKTLHNALQTLNDRDHYIIKHVYLQDPPKSLADIGRKFNISRERSRQIVKRALREMHYFLTHTEHISPKDLKSD